MSRTRVVIMGAAGRDFHDFNTVFRGDERFDVVAFTHTGTQNIGELDDLPNRRYPPELAGEDYPEGTPIRAESELETIVNEEDVDTVVFSYSDVSHEHVMDQTSRVLAAGADFRLIGPDRMMLHAEVPVVAVDAVRTGCGKSQTARKFADLLLERGKDVAVVSEPMPYGVLVDQRVQRFESMDDLDESNVTIEEREEYESHIERGHVVYAGVDYEAILDRVQTDAEIIVWDGGKTNPHSTSPMSTSSWPIPTVPGPNCDTIRVKPTSASRTTSSSTRRTPPTSPGFARSKQTFGKRIQTRKSFTRTRPLRPTGTPSLENAFLSSKTDRRSLTVTNPMVPA
jgi:predicted GTPase